MAYIFVKVPFPEKYSNYIGEYCSNKTRSLGASASVNPEGKVNVDIDDATSIFYMGYYTFYYLKRLNADISDFEVWFEDLQGVRDEEISVVSTSKDLVLNALEKVGREFKINCSITKEHQLLTYKSHINCEHVSDEILFRFGFLFCEIVYDKNHIGLI